VGESGFGEAGLSVDEDCVEGAVLVWGGVEVEDVDELWGEDSGGLLGDFGGWDGFGFGDEGDESCGVSRSGGDFGSVEGGDDFSDGRGFGGGGGGLGGDDGEVALEGSLNEACGAVLCGGEV
jgi:hypothetical protein